MYLITLLTYNRAYNSLGVSVKQKRRLPRGKRLAIVQNTTN